MKLLLTVLLLLASTVSEAYTVKGYVRKNGTYVAPYQRTMPDSNPYNNRGFYEQGKLPSTMPKYEAYKPYNSYKPYQAPSYSNPYETDDSEDTEY